MLTARDRMWFFADNNHKWIDEQALYKTDAKIKYSMNDATNLADQNMQNMLSFVKILTKKSLYSSLNILMNVRKL